MLIARDENQAPVKLMGKLPLSSVGQGFHPMSLESVLVTSVCNTLGVTNQMLSEPDMPHLVASLLLGSLYKEAVLRVKIPVFCSHLCCVPGNIRALLCISLSSPVSSGEAKKGFSFLLCLCTVPATAGPQSWLVLQ